MTEVAEKHSYMLDDNERLCEELFFGNEDYADYKPPDGWRVIRVMGSVFQRRGFFKPVRANMCVILERNPETVSPALRETK